MEEILFGVKIISGQDSLEELNKIKKGSVMIVTDQSMIKFGAVEKIKAYLKQDDFYVFDGVAPDPPVSVIAEGTQALQRSSADTIIALGGGSVIDTAKALRFVYSRMIKKSPQDIELIAIPTTSGTGSEVTDFAVISDPENGIKYPLKGEELRADIAILAPELTTSVPPSVTADTGMDALTHAIEAYVSTASNTFTDALCEKSISIIFEYLPIAVQDGSNFEARQMLMNASCMAGMAFNAAGLGVNHGMAHAIGGKFHISHGRSCAMIMPAVIRFNAELDTVKGGAYSAAARKYQKLAVMLNLSNGGTRVCVNALIRRIEKMLSAFDIPATLKKAGVDMESFADNRTAMAESAVKDSTTQSNPRPVSVQQAEELLLQISGARTVSR